MNKRINQIAKRVARKEIKSFNYDKSEIANTFETKYLKQQVPFSKAIISDIQNLVVSLRKNENVDRAIDNLDKMIHGSLRGAVDLFSSEFLFNHIAQLLKDLEKAKVST